MLKHRFLLAVAILSFSFSPLQAATVLQDDFNRVGSLGGSTPTINTGQSWTATSPFTTNGTRLVAEGSFLQAASLPVTITSGKVYTLSATTFRNDASSDTLAFMMIGFFDSAPTWDGGQTVNNGHAIAIGPRNDVASSVAPFLNGHLSPSDVSSPDGTNGVTFGVRLYETTPNSWSADIVELAPTVRLLTAAPTPVSISNVSTVGLLSGATHPPFIDNFTLTVTTASLPGDYNNNGVVDAADYVLWRVKQGTNTALPNDAIGSTIGVAQYAQWRAHFGQTAGSGSGVLASAGVPEPATVSLMILAAVGAWWPQRRRSW